MSLRPACAAMSRCYATVHIDAASAAIDAVYCAEVLFYTVYSFSAARYQFHDAARLFFIACNQDEPRDPEKALSYDDGAAFICRAVPARKAQDYFFRSKTSLLPFLSSRAAATRYAISPCCYADAV